MSSTNSQSGSNSTNNQSNSNRTWRIFTPIMPAFIRMIAGVVVLVIIEAVVLSFPGISQNVGTSTVTIADIAVFCIGLFVAFIVSLFGAQLSKAVSDAYKNLHTLVPLLSFAFQILAIFILYTVSNNIASSSFSGAPWAYPLIFLLIALIPTLRVVLNLVHAMDNSSKTKNVSNN